MKSDEKNGDQILTNQETEFVKKRLKLPLDEFKKLTPPDTMKVCPEWGCDFGIIDLRGNTNLPENERIKYECYLCKGIGYIKK